MYVCMYVCMYVWLWPELPGAANDGAQGFGGVLMAGKRQSWPVVVGEVPGRGLPEIRPRLASCGRFSTLAVARVAPGSCHKFDLDKSQHSTPPVFPGAAPALA